MNYRKHMFALGGSLLLGLAGVTIADTTPTGTDVQAELSALRARVQELEGKQSDNWLNQRRAEEVKALVKEVLSDADTRASLLENGMSAGHNGRNFFLASEDGNFLMNISGQLQVRYIWTHRRNPDSSDATLTATQAEDGDVSGFSIARAKVQFDGHIANPDWLYSLRLAADRSDGSVAAEEATIGYRLMDNLTLRAGRMKGQFLRESLTSDAHQLAVERSLVDAVFSAGYLEGIFASWDVSDMIHISASFDDGDGSGNVGTGAVAGILGGGTASAANDYYQDVTDFAGGARVDVKIAGDWKQMQDFSAWSGEETGIFVGAAVRYNQFETGNTGSNGDFIKWTVDGSVEMAGLSIYGAVVGLHTQADDAGTPITTNAYGALGQVAYMVIPDKLEPFARFEWIRQLDNSISQNEVKIITAGVNYYVAKHAAKVTLDVVYALDPIDNSDSFVPASGGGNGISGLGLLDDSSNDGQVAVRAQFQLLF